MAHMVPASPCGNAAERRVFRYLEHGFADRHDVWVFQELQTSDGPADFVIVAPEFGVLVVEVKAWDSGAILEPGPTSWRVREGGSEATKSSPLEQARRFSYAIRDSLKSVPALVASGGRGNLVVPVSAVAALPNLSQRDYVERNFQSVLPSQWALLREDLSPAATRNAARRLGEALRDWQKGRSPDRRLVQVALDHLRPRVIPASGAPTIEGFREGVLFLEEKQLLAAARLGPGRHVVEGPQGCGKTLVLVHRACRVARERPEARVLFLCFNLSLEAHLRRLVHRQGIGTGPRPGRVQVAQFFDFVGVLLGEEVDHARREPAYFDDLLHRALAASSPEYDLVLVDEAQDFSTEMLQVAAHAAGPRGELVVALDEDQSLYQRTRDFAQAGLDGAKRHRLGAGYRNSRGIQHLLAALVGARRGASADVGYATLEGESPRAVELAGTTTLAEFLADDIDARLRDGHQRLGDIAILYNDKKYEGGDFRDGPRGFVRDVVQELDARAISSFWVSEDVRSKQLFDAALDRVTIASIHSAKGLDLGVVYLVGVEDWESKSESRVQLDALLRVGMGRACFGLVVPYRRRTPLIERILATGAIEDMTIEEAPPTAG